jgi:ribosomal protein L3 glutamine methyltransferase
VSRPNNIRRVLDLCTGSGCLAILAAKVFPKAHIDAVDLSDEALSLAHQNVRDHQVQRRVKLLAGDLFGPVKGERYDLIITNPPYVTAASMRRLPPEYRHEPRMALAAGADGLDLVKKIILHAADHLRADGALLCEVGAARKALERSFKGLPFFWLETELSSDEVFWLSRNELIAGL